MADEVKQFIFELHNPDNKNRKWRFNIIGDVVIIGKVIKHVETGRAIPITLMVQPDQGSIKEIPWSSIQYINSPEGDN